MMPLQTQMLRGKLRVPANLSGAVPGVWAPSPVATDIPQPAGLFRLQTVNRPVITNPSAPVVTHYPPLLVGP